jgi:ribosomal protein S18 acetylase RimI-like enzyme
MNWQQRNEMKNTAGSDSTNLSITLAQTDAEIEECWPVMAQLRTHLTQKEYVSAVREQFGEGYQLAFVRRDGRVAAVAGFRLLQSLAWGRFCYVDDLVTDERTRSQGLGGELLRWLCEYARAKGCRRVELDSGVQRFAAHRFYFQQRMFVSCYHFSLDLSEPKA